MGAGVSSGQIILEIWLDDFGKRLSTILLTVNVRLAFIEPGRCRVTADEIAGRRVWDVSGRKIKRSRRGLMFGCLCPPSFILTIRTEPSR